MNNEQFWNCIKQFEHQNAEGKELLCDKMVKAGLGQTCGGYFDEDIRKKYNVKIDRAMAEPSQLFHFKEYYVDENMVYGEIHHAAKDNPSYHKLWCPQLMLFIAEMAGLNKILLENAYRFVEEYETETGIIGKDNKTGGYLKEKIKEYRIILHMKEITDIISEEEEYDIILTRVGRIE